MVKEGKENPMKSPYRNFKPDFWLLISSVFLMRIGQFMVFPFLAILLTKQFHSDPVTVGLVLGASSIAFALSSINCGHLVDRHGAKSIIIASIIIGAVAFICLFLLHSVIAYFFLNIALGISRSAFSAASRTYIYLVVEAKQRPMAYGINYIAINAGFGLGLLVGTLYAMGNSTTLFMWIGLSYFILALLVYYILPDKRADTNHAYLVTLRNTFSTVFADHKLLFLILAGVVLWFAYVQTDSAFPIYLVTISTHGVLMYAEIIAVNALLACTLQPLTSRLMQRFTMLQQAIFGIILFMIGYLCYVFFNTLLWFMLGMALITLGELIIFPLMDVWTGILTKPERAGAYYAAGNFTMFGNALGPAIGGWIYQSLGIHTLFFLCAIAALISIPLYRRAIPAIKN
jgi:MFS family permease